jgi:carbamoyltransferase
MVLMPGAKRYIGLSSSCNQGSIAVVNSNGELVFAEADGRLLDANPDRSWLLEEALEQYCPPDTEIVISTAASAPLKTDAGKLPCLNRGAIESHLSTGRGNGRCVSKALRAAAASHAYSQRCEFYMMSRLISTVEYELQRMRGWPSTQFQRRQYNQHLSHAAAACLTSPYSDALCAVLDGSEGHACTCYAYRDGALFEITPARKPMHEGALGRFYREICDACGFRSILGEHWKAMSLASLGELDWTTYQILTKFITTEGLSLKAADDYQMADLYEQIESLSRKPYESVLNAANLAYTGQVVFEECLYSLLKTLHATALSDNLVFTGGCALNASANGRLLRNTPFKNLHVPCAPSNVGNAIGAALLAYQEDHPSSRPRPGFQTAFLGSEIAAKSLSKVMIGHGLYETQLCNGAAPDRAASLLAGGKVVAWIQGRAEFGRCALGNRSILADPRRADISAMTSWMVGDSPEILPIGLSVLHEYGSECFDNYQVAPYMERALCIRPKMARRIPGVVSKNGTARIQTVKRDWNEKFYDLIFSFYRMTGIPMVINIDYGASQGGVLKTPEDLVLALSASRIDALCMDNLLLFKKDGCGLTPPVHRTLGANATHTS